jgi:transcriptional regulator with XRE-family HTH domain
MVQVGEKIKRFREVRNYTQEYVAQQLDMTPQGYGKIERNEVDVTVQKLETIATILGTTLQDIFSFDEKIIFNNKDFQHNNFMCNNTGAIDFIKEVYESRITDLQNEIAFLRDLLKAKG